MKTLTLCLLCSVLAAGLSSCSTNDPGKDARASDLGVGEGAALPDGLGPLWECPTPGVPCEAHNSCVMAAICGNDTPKPLCHPTKLQNCDDGLACTQDLCKGSGVCLNVPRTGTCALPVKVEKDGVTTTEVRCFNHGDRNPTDSCLVCNAGQDGGNAGEWGLANGGPCDDKNPCTKNDYCQSGTCKGEDYTKECADKFSCTADICDGQGGCGTEHKLQSDWCLIKQGSAEAVCYKDGQQDASGCNTCDVTKSQSAWTPLSVHCLINNVCYKPLAKDSAGCSICDPDKNPTGWTPIAGLCKIDNVCYQAGALHPQGCAECDPATSATAWTVKGTANCLIGPTCYKSGAKDSTGCQYCDPTKSTTAWSTVADMCKISSKCYAALAKHPQGCADCEPTISTTTWTVNTDNCLISNTCYAPGAKDSSGCASCDPVKSKTDWSPLPSLCKINSKCYTGGSKDPTGCAECDPATSATAWTVKGNSCLIGNTCYTPAQTSSSGCGVCDPTKSKTDWTPVAGKCSIGQTCFADGAKDTTGCLSCDVAKNPIGWTPVAGVSSTFYNFDDGKSPPTGWTLKNTDAKVGWVVSNRRASSGSYSLYYGDPAVGNYDTGSMDNSGTATLPAITLTAGKKAGLSFWLYMDTEEGTFDGLTVTVNGTNVVWEKDDTNVVMNAWQEITIDLSAYAGQSVTIDFTFDTGDGISNDGEGTFIDSVTVYHNC